MCIKISPFKIGDLVWCPIDDETGELFPTGEHGKKESIALVTGIEKDTVTVIYMKTGSVYDIIEDTWVVENLRLVK